MKKIRRTRESLGFSVLISFANLLATAAGLATIIFSDDLPSRVAALFILMPICLLGYYGIYLDYKEGK